MKAQKSHNATFAPSVRTIIVQCTSSRHTVQCHWHLQSSSLSRAVRSFNLPGILGASRRVTAKAGHYCSCSESAARAAISRALVLSMSGVLATLDGSPSAARPRRAVTSHTSAPRAFWRPRWTCMVWGVRRRVGPVRQICSTSMRALPLVQRATAVRPLGRCSVSLSETTWLLQKPNPVPLQTLIA